MVLTSAMNWLEDAVARAESDSGCGDDDVVSVVMSLSDESVHISQGGENNNDCDDGNDVGH